MIDIMLAFVCGYLLALNVKRFWVGLLACVLSGVVIGFVLTYATVLLYEINGLIRVIPIDDPRIFEAIAENSQKSITFTLLFFILQRFIFRKKKNTLKEEQPQ